MFITHCVALAAGVVALELWANSGVWRSAFVDGKPVFVMERRPLSEVWAEHHANRLIAIDEFVFSAVIAALGFGSLLLAWLSLPRVYRAGPILPAFARAHRIVCSAAGVVVLLALGLVWIVAGLENAFLRGSFTDVEQSMLAVSMVASPCVLLIWIGRAIGTLPPQPLDIELPPRCEDCGYDLTPNTLDDVCPECGLAVAASRVPGRRRRPDRWSATRSLEAWATTTLAVIFRPTRFYQRLAVRSEQLAGDAFARLHLVAVGVVASLWFNICLFLYVHDLDPENVIAFVGMPLFLAPLVAWLTHRGLAAAATTIGIAARALPDFAWAARAIAFETAFVWVHCLFSGLLFTTFFIADNWMSELLGSAGFIRTFGFPPEPGAVLFGNLALCVVWLWRFRRIGHAIRWANE